MWQRVRRASRRSERRRSRISRRPRRRDNVVTFRIISLKLRKVVKKISKLEKVIVPVETAQTES